MGEEVEAPTGRAGDGDGGDGADGRDDAGGEDPFYEAAVAHPEGTSTAARLALTAAEYGFGGVVVRNADAVPGFGPGGGGDGDEGAPGPAAIREAYGVDVVTGVEVDAADPATASGRIGNVRSADRTDYTVLAVRGGTAELNRFAAEQDRMDVLARPLGGIDGPERGVFDHVVADEAREHGVRVEVDLSPVLHRSGGGRVRALSALRRLREILADRDAPFVVSARPRSHLQFRAPRELLAVGERVGFDRETVRAGLREWGRLAARNRERASESFIEPGVKRGRYEEDP